MSSKLTFKEFKKGHIKDYKRLVVVAGGKGCGPCKEAKPRVVALSEHKDFRDVKFRELDCDDSSSLADDLKIRTLPTYVLFYDHKEVARICGADTDKLRSAMGKHF